MKLKNLIIISVVIIALIIFGLYIFSNTKTDNESPIKQTTAPSENNINFTASFAIFTNGTFRDFTDPKYHNQSSEIFMEKANVVIVNKDGTTWGDFFKTLPMNLSKDCLITGTGQEFCSNESSRLRFFLNNKENPNALNKKISAGDKLLITFGTETENQIKLQLDQVPDL